MRMNKQLSFLFLIAAILLLGFPSCIKEKPPKKNPNQTGGNKDKEVFLNNVSWKKVKTGPFDGAIVTSTAQFNGKIYVSTENGIYTSTNAKQFSFDKKLDNLYLVGIELHQSGNELFAFSQGSDIFRLNNNNWDKLTISGLTTPLKNYTNQMLCNDSGHIFLFSSDNQGSNLFFLSKDKGQTWTPISTPTGAYHMFAIYNKNELLLLSKTGVMHSTNGGTSWQSAVDGFTNLTRFFVHPDGSQMIIYDSRDNLMISGTLSNLVSKYASIGNNMLIGYNDDGILFTSDVSDDNNQFIKFSNNNGRTWVSLGITPKFLTQASIVGGSVLGVMESSLIYLEDGAVRYKLYGAPTLPIVDFIKKDKKITAVGANTMVYISNDNGHTWDIGSVKDPFAAAKCLYINEDNSIWIGTTSGLFIVDAYASSVILNQSFNLPDYHISAIDRSRGYTIIGLSHKNLNSGYIALAQDNSITKYTLSQIYGKQNLAICYVEVSYFSNSLPNFKVSLYAPGQSVWYDCFSTLNGRVITTWETIKNDYFGGNAFIKANTNLAKGYTLYLYQGNNYSIGGKDRIPSKGKLNTSGKVTNFWIDEADYGWALIDGYLNISSTELVTE